MSGEVYSCAQENCCNLPTEQSWVGRYQSRISMKILREVLREHFQLNPMSILPLCVKKSDCSIML